MDDLLQEAAAGAGCIAGRVGCDDHAPMTREMHRLSLRDWPRVVAPGVPPPLIKDCGDYNWHAPQPGISKWESGCPPWQLTGHVRPYTRAERISRMMISNPGRVVAARRDALNDERLSAERALSQAIWEGSLLPSEIAVLERRFHALEKELYGPPPNPGRWCSKRRRWAPAPPGKIQKVGLDCARRTTIATASVANGTGYFGRTPPGIFDIFIL